MSILFENCDLLLRGEDGVYSTLHGFLGVRGDTIDYIGTEKPRRPDQRGGLGNPEVRLDPQRDPEIRHL